MKLITIPPNSVRSDSLPSQATGRNLNQSTLANAQADWTQIAYLDCNAFISKFKQFDSRIRFFTIHPDEFVPIWSITADGIIRELTGMITITEVWGPHMIEVLHLSRF